MSLDYITKPESLAHFNSTTRFSTSGAPKNFSELFEEMGNVL